MEDENRRKICPLLENGRLAGVVGDNGAAAPYWTTEDGLCRHERCAWWGDVGIDEEGACAIALFLKRQP